MAINRAAFLRRGFSFQDSYGMLLCSEWLKDPKKYKSIQFEYVPEGISGGFSLDDISLTLPDGKTQFYQAKYKDDVDFKWSWDDLLLQEKGSKGKLKPSLLQRWESSLTGAGNISYAALVTNARADVSISRHMKNMLVNPVTLRSRNSKVYAKIVQQFGSEERVVSFFSKFHFDFGLDDIREQIINNLEPLGVTKSGRDQLTLMIQDEASRTHTVRLTLEKIRNGCSFDKPRPLVEDILLPEDFQVFDTTVHAKICSDLESKEGGVRVLVGKPGAGKTTYLSYLSNFLEDNARKVIKHHYYLGPDDTSGIQRLDADRAIEAIKEQILRDRDLLGDVANKMPSQTPLREYIEDLARQSYNSGTSAVMIIDGLDHVIRQKNSDQLRTLLDAVAYPVPGIWIILGTQESAREFIPPSLARVKNEEQWIEVKGFSRKSIRRIIKTNTTGLHLPQSKELVDEFIDSIFRITQGNPLHLRYSLQELQNMRPDRFITSDVCKGLISYSGDIEVYYESLWGKLSDGSKHMLVLMASIDFLLKKSWFMDIVTGNPELFEPKSLASDLSKIQHLILRSNREYFSIYHNSFLEFIAHSDEFASSANSARRAILDWLYSSNKEGLKWSEAKKLEYYVGDKNAIVDIDHGWLIDAICNFRSVQAVTKQLDLALKVSIENQNYGLAFRFYAYKNYFENSIEFNDDTHEKVWVEAFRSRFNDVNLDTVENIDFSLLTSQELYEIVLWADKKGEVEIVNLIYDVFVDMHPIQTRSKDGIERVPQIPYYFIKSAVHTPHHEIQRIQKYIKQFRKQGWSSELYAGYANELVTSGRSWMVAELLKDRLVQPEKKAILDICLRHLVASDKPLDSDLLKIFSHRRSEDPEGMLILMILGKKISTLPELPRREDMPDSVPDHNFKGRPERSSYLTSVFMKGAIYGLKSEPIQFIQEDDWLSDAMNLLLEWGYEYGQSLLNKDSYALSVGLEKFDKIPKLTWPENRDSTFEFEIALEECFQNIALLTFILGLHTKDSYSVDRDEAEAIMQNVRFRPSRLLDTLLSLGREVLTKDAYKLLTQKITESLDSSLDTFPERTSTYVKLAQLSYIHIDKDNNLSMIELASRNLMGYGYHKDMYLSSIMDCVQACIDAGVSLDVIERWIHRLSPIIQNVPDFTDGDETHYFPTFLADLLANADMGLAYSYYLFQFSKESYYDAQSIFAKYFKKLSLDNSVERALLSTVTDEVGQQALIELSHQNPIAEEVLGEMNDFYGDIKLENKNSQYSDNYKEPKHDFSLLKPDNLEKDSVPGSEFWETQNYLSGWLKYWKVKEEKGAYLALKRVYGDLIEFRELLDGLYPLAYKYDDRAYAFKLLCQAHIENYGWSPYWTEYDRALKRWEFLKENFPNRHGDFLENTLKNNRLGELSMPIPRVVQFFAFFEENKKLVEVTSEAVKFAENLMANINLPDKDWLSLKTSALDVLFERLKSPSPLTRERTVMALARLIGDDKELGVLEKLIDWIQDQVLETYMLIGLIAIERASTIYKLEGYKSTLVEKLPDIPVKSLVMKEVLDKVAMQENLTLEFELVRDEYKTPPSDYETSEFFRKYIKSFLSQVHMDRANTIEENTWLPFIAFWSYTATQLMIKMGCKEELNDVNYYAWNTGSPHRIAVSFRLSEVYRTSYLRTLQYFYDQGWIPEDYYLEYTLATMPVDLSYWSILPGRVPPWWPKYNDIEDIKNNPEDVLADSLMRSTKRVPLYMTGALQPPVWGSGSEVAGIQIVAFGYKISDEQKNSDEDLAKKVMATLPYMIQFPDSERRYEALNDLIIPISRSKVERVDGLSVYHLVGHLHPLSVPIWQWYREAHGSLLPLPYVVSNSKLLHKKHGFVHEDEGNVIGEYREWTQGVSERLDPNSLPPFGAYYDISGDFLTTHLADEGFNLGYAYRMTTREGDIWKSNVIQKFGFVKPLSNTNEVKKD